MSIRIGIVTVSDRASQGVYEDKGGPAIRDCLDRDPVVPVGAGRPRHPRRAAAHRGRR